MHQWPSQPSPHVSLLVPLLPLCSTPPENACVASGGSCRIQWIQHLAASSIHHATKMGKIHELNHHFPVRYVNVYQRLFDGICSIPRHPKLCWIAVYIARTVSPLRRTAKQCGRSSVQVSTQGVQCPQPVSLPSWQWNPVPSIEQSAKAGLEKKAEPQQTSCTIPDELWVLALFS